MSEPTLLYVLALNRASTMLHMPYSSVVTVCTFHATYALHSDTQFIINGQWYFDCLPEVRSIGHGVSRQGTLDAIANNDPRVAPTVAIDFYHRSILPHSKAFNRRPGIFQVSPCSVRLACLALSGHRVRTHLYIYILIHIVEGTRGTVLLRTSSD